MISYDVIVFLLCLFIIDENQREECQRLLGDRVNSIDGKVEKPLVPNPQNKQTNEKKSHNNGNKPILEPNPPDKLPDEIVGKEFNNKRYQAVTYLGYGSFGSVYQVDDRNDPNVSQKAMKILEYTLEAENELFLIQSTATHENIVRYFHHFELLKGQTHNLCIITEYCSVRISK